MYRIALADLQIDPDKVFALIDAGETVVVTLNGHDYMRMVPVADADGDEEQVRDGR